MILRRIATADGGVALSPAVTLGDAKRHLNVYHAEDDDLIEALVAVAQAHLEGHDGTGGVLGRPVSRHTLELTLPRFPLDRVMPLPHPPLVSVTEIAYRDQSGVDRIFDAGLYHVVPDGMQGSVRLRVNASWPGTEDAPDAVRVRFVVGPSICPPDLRHAMLLHVGTLYLNREATGTNAVVLPMAWKALVDPHRTHGWI
jgi:uncharacterized phiE125 gp8 family phage protein